MEYWSNLQCQCFLSWWPIFWGTWPLWNEIEAKLKLKSMKKMLNDWALLICFECEYIQCIFIKITAVKKIVSKSICNVRISVITKFIQLSLSLILKWLYSPTSLNRPSFIRTPLLTGHVLWPVSLFYSLLNSPKSLTFLVLFQLLTQRKTLLIIYSHPPYKSSPYKSSHIRPYHLYHGPY